MFRVVSCARIVLAASLLAPATVAGATPRSPASADAPYFERPGRDPATDFAPGEVLVRFDRAAPLSVRQSAIAGIGAELAAQDNVLDYARLRLPEGASVERAIEFLRAKAGVVRAEPNYHYYPATPFDVPQDAALRDTTTGPNQWGVFKCGVPRLWRHGGGGMPDIRIAIIDTGIDNFLSPHADLAANLFPQGRDFVDGDTNPTDVGADAGHGTHVAGIAAAVSDSNGIAGVSYDARIMVVRVLDCTSPNCPGTADAIAAGIRWAADQGAHVINLSLGGPGSFVIESAVGYAAEKQCILVAASGNDGASSVSHPAAYEPVVAVGATDSGDAVASFSNYGSALDVVAPGVQIYAPWPGGYVSINGTSMASPFVAGIAALMRAKSPGLKPLEFQAWIRKQTRDLAGTRDGYGRVDFWRLEDWSDATPGYPAVTHREFLWEWLGDDASSETSVADTRDTDGRRNIGGSHDRDAYDDGVFPHSIGDMPWLPPHLSMAPAMVHVKESVGRHDGPRYGPAPSKSLHLDSWFDWNTDRSFTSPGDRVVIDAVENPASWGSNSKVVARVISPPDEHLLGNPLVIRSRLAYGASVGSPSATPAATGEVEDTEVINFVEDFDVSLHALNPGVFMDMGAWVVTSDPSPTWPYCQHHGLWEHASTEHPVVGFPCNGVIEATNVMSTPVMDLREYTNAYLRFWFCHQNDDCGPPFDMCRVRIDTSGVKIDLAPLPWGGGDVQIDLTPYVGCSSVKIEFVEETDWPGELAIDDVVIWAYDAEKPLAVSDLTGSRTPGTTTVDLTWSHPWENGAPAPSDPLANSYDIRWSTFPIVGEAGWKRATPFLPRDGAIPVPALSGTVTTNFELPSVFQPYSIAVRIGDEVTNLSAISNQARVFPSPAPAVDMTSPGEAVIAPGDTAFLTVTVINTGNVPDAFSMRATGTLAWPIDTHPAVVALDPGGAATVHVDVAVPYGAGAGETDSITVFATSTSDPSVNTSRKGIVWAVTRTGVEAGLPATASLRLSGANPFRGGTSFSLSLPRPASGRATVYDVAGRRVRLLADGGFPAGIAEIAWDGRDDRGAEAGAGVYFFELRTDALTRRERLVLVR